MLYMLLYAVRTMASTRTQIYLTAEQRERLDELAKRERKTLAQLIREAVDRFLQEAHTAAKFSSNNVVQAIDVGSAGNLHYFVMEYVEGKTVQDELNRGKVFEEKEALDIILQVAQALHHGNVHREQICAAITRLGMEPPDVQAWSYGEATGRGRELPRPPS